MAQPRARGRRRSPRLSRRPPRRHARRQLQPEPARQLDQRGPGPALAGLGRERRRRLAERGRRAQLPGSALDERVPARAGRAGDAPGRRQDADRHADRLVEPAVLAAALVGRRRRDVAGRGAARSRRALRLRRRPALRRRGAGHGRSGGCAHGLVLPGQPLRHARRRAHLGGRDAALRAPVALRGARDRAGQAAHAAPALCSRRPGTPSACPARLLRSVNGGATWRARQGPALPAARLQRPRARVRPRQALDGVS